MADVPQIDIVDGAPTTGTGTVQTLSTVTDRQGATNETAPASDTATSAINGRLQRIAQRITSMIGLLPTALGAGGGIKVDGSGTALPVSVATLPSHAVTNAGTFAVQVPADPFGANADAGSATGSISAKLRFIAVTGIPITGTVTVTGATGGHTSTGIGHGVKTVTTAGTDVVLASSTAAKSVMIQAQTDNTGWIAVGATGVDATEATGTGILLDAGESLTLNIDNLADVFIDATVSGEGVRFTYET